MRELRPVVDVRLYEAVLLLGRRVVARLARVGEGIVVVVVTPLDKVVGELVAYDVGGSVLKVNDDELLVLVGRLKERRFLVVGPLSEDVAVLRLLLFSISSLSRIMGVQRTSPCANTSCSCIFFSPP